MKKVVLLILLVITMLSLMILTLQNRTEIGDSLYLSTRRIPEPITELYFTEPSNIPIYVNAGDSFDISFTVVNNTQTDNEYTYIVYTEVNGIRTIISEDKLMIESQNNKVVSLETLNESSERQKFVVEILNLNQLISFWIN